MTNLQQKMVGPKPQSSDMNLHCFFKGLLYKPHDMKLANGVFFCIKPPDLLTSSPQGMVKSHKLYISTCFISVTNIILYFILYYILYIIYYIILYIIYYM